MSEESSLDRQCYTQNSSMHPTYAQHASTIRPAYTQHVSSIRPAYVEHASSIRPVSTESLTSVLVTDDCSHFTSHHSRLSSRHVEVDNLALESGEMIPEYTGVTHGRTQVLNECIGVTSGFTGVTTGFTGVTSGFTGITSGFTGVTSGFTGVTSGFTGVTSGFTGVTTGFTMVSDELSDPGRRASSLSSNYHQAASRSVPVPTTLQLFCTTSSPIMLDPLPTFTSAQVDCVILPAYVMPVRQLSEPYSQARSRPSSRMHAWRQMFSLSPLPEEGGGAKECCSRECCVQCLVTVTTFRWVLLFFAMVGICCIVCGVILGAMHMSVGNSFLTLSIMFVGLGVLLVIVIGIGWRCTPAGHEPCHLLFNLGDAWMMQSRGRHSSDLRSGGRQRLTDRNQWLAGMIYPEFEYRVPPPSYNESLEIYHQVVLQQRHLCSTVSHPQTPPPAYHSDTGTLYTSAYSVPPRGQFTSQPPGYRTYDTRRRRGDGRSTPSQPVRSGPQDSCHRAPRTIVVDVENCPLACSSSTPDVDHQLVTDSSWLDRVISRDPTLQSFSPLSECRYTAGEDMGDQLVHQSVDNSELACCEDNSELACSEAISVAAVDERLCDVQPESCLTESHTDRSVTDGGVTESLTNRSVTDGGVTDSSVSDVGVTERSVTDVDVTESYTDRPVTDVGLIGRPMTDTETRAVSSVTEIDLTVLDIDQSLTESFQDEYDRSATELSSTYPIEWPLTEVVE